MLILILIVINFYKANRQTNRKSSLFPSLPPNRFLYLDKKKRVVYANSVKDGRWHYNTYAKIKGWNKKKKKYVEDALYKNIFYTHCSIINPAKGERIDIN